jgi:hypothetical protein
LKSLKAWFITFWIWLVTGKSFVEMCAAAELRVLAQTRKKIFDGEPLTRAEDEFLQVILKNGGATDEARLAVKNMKLFMANYTR